MRLFKIHPEALAKASTETLAWAPIDEQDGFVHLSTAEQVVETARRHFSGQQDLWLMELDSDALVELRFEASRGGALFPHVYGRVPAAAILGRWRLPWDEHAQAFVWPDLGQGPE